MGMFSQIKEMFSYFQDGIIAYIFEIHPILW